MVQHAETVDEIEPLGEDRKVEDVGLQVLDIGEAVLLGLPHRVAEARAAEVDGQDRRILVGVGDPHGLQSGAAARDEHTRALDFGRLAFTKMRQRDAHSVGEGKRSSDATPRPPGIGALSVLLLDRK